MLASKPSFLAGWTHLSDGRFSFQKVLERDQHAVAEVYIPNKTSLNCAKRLLPPRVPVGPLAAILMKWRVIRGWSSYRTVFKDRVWDSVSEEVWLDRVGRWWFDLTSQELRWRYLTGRKVKGLEADARESSSATPSVTGFDRTTSCTDIFVSFGWLTWFPTKGNHEWICGNHVQIGLEIIYLIVTSRVLVIKKHLTTLWLGKGVLVLAGGSQPCIY